MSDDLMHLMIFLGVFNGAVPAAALPATPQSQELSACARRGRDLKAPPEAPQRAPAAAYRKTGSATKDMCAFQAHSEDVTVRTVAPPPPRGRHPISTT